MTALLGALGRVLGVTLVLRVSDDLSPGRARWLKATVVLVVGLTPVAAVLAGVLGYGDVWLWLAVEVVTIYVWTTVRLVRTAPSSGELGRFGLHFFTLHYGGFAVVPFVLGVFIVLPWSPPHSPWLTVVALGGLGFVAAGWLARPFIRDRVGVGLGGFVQAYARMVLAYVALFVPLLVTGTRSASMDAPLPPIPAERETVVAVAVLLAKLALELGLVVGAGSRAGGALLRTWTLTLPGPEG